MRSAAYERRFREITDANLAKSGISFDSSVHRQVQNEMRRDRRRKTKPGPVFTSTLEVCAALLAGQWVYTEGRPYHYGWAMSWGLGRISRLVSLKAIYRCLDAKTGEPYQGRSK